MMRGLTAGLLAVLLMGPATGAPESVDFGGRWVTTYGPMTLTQKGDRVSGTYVMDGVPCKISGKVQGRRLAFRYEEPKVRGEGWFDLGADGKKFQGKWREEGAEAWMPWTGERPHKAPHQTFDGLWKSSFGRMRLVQEEGKVEGIYAFGGGSTLTGRVQGRKLTFTYAEPSTEVKGEGTFVLSDDARSLTGTWRESGSEAWAPWTATRLLPKAGLTWLVVVEARWESGLAEQEYSFGTMLSAFFARSSAVRVRRRIFNDEPDLRKWCRETAYLAEPVVLCIASHGQAEGVQVGGKIIGPKAIADSLKYAGNTTLLHLSSCLAMKGGLAKKIMKLSHARFPISGYTTSVDWAGSAVIEFMYFDLVLVKNLPPEAAAKQIAVLMPFSGPCPIEGSILAPAGFRILMPDLAEE